MSSKNKRFTLLLVETQCLRVSLILSTQIFPEWNTSLHCQSAVSLSILTATGARRQSDVSCRSVAFQLTNVYPFRGFGVGSIQCRSTESHLMSIVWALNIKLATTRNKNEQQDAKNNAELWTK